jgi:hypothetical protein
MLSSRKQIVIYIYSGTLCLPQPPPSSAEVKERVELYLLSPSWPSWPVLGRTLPVPNSALRYL